MVSGRTDSLRGSSSQRLIAAGEWARSRSRPPFRGSLPVAGDDRSARAGSDPDPSRGPHEPAQRAEAADDAVAGNDQRDRVGAAGLADRACRGDHLARELAVGARLAGRDVEDRVPDAALERRALGAIGTVNRKRGIVEVALELACRSGDAIGRCDQGRAAGTTRAAVGRDPSAPNGARMTAESAASRTSPSCGAPGATSPTASRVMPALARALATRSATWSAARVTTARVDRALEPVGVDLREPAHDSLGILRRMDDDDCPRRIDSNQDQRIAPAGERAAPKRPWSAPTAHRATFAGPGATDHGCAPGCSARSAIAIRCTARADDGRSPGPEERLRTRSRRAASSSDLSRSRRSTRAPQASRTLRVRRVSRPVRWRERTAPHRAAVERALGHRGAHRRPVPWRRRKRRDGGDRRWHVASMHVVAPGGGDSGRLERAGGGRAFGSSAARLVRRPLPQGRREAAGVRGGDRRDRAIAAGAPSRISRVRWKSATPNASPVAPSRGSRACSAFGSSGYSTSVRSSAPRHVHPASTCASARPEIACTPRCTAFAEPRRAQAQVGAGRAAAIEVRAHAGARRSDVGTEAERRRVDHDEIAPVGDLRDEVAVFDAVEFAAETATQRDYGRAEQRRLPARDRPVVEQGTVERQAVQPLEPAVGAEPARVTVHGEGFGMRKRRLDQRRDVLRRAGIVVVQVPEILAGDGLEAEVRGCGAIEPPAVPDEPDAMPGPPAHFRQRWMGAAGRIDDDDLERGIVLRGERGERLPELGPGHAAHDDRDERRRVRPARGRRGGEAGFIIAAVRSPGRRSGPADATARRRGAGARPAQPIFICCGSQVTSPGKNQMSSTART